VGHNQNSPQPWGRAGPIVFEDYLLFEKMGALQPRAQFRNAWVYAKGSGAHGATFVCTSKDITRYRTAKLGSVGKKDTYVHCFSTAGRRKKRNRQDTEARFRRGLCPGKKGSGTRNHLNPFDLTKVWAAI